MTPEQGAGESGTAAAEPPEITYVPVAGSPPEILDLGRVVLRRWSVEDVDAQEAAVARSVAHLTPFMGWAAGADMQTSMDYLERVTRQWGARETFQYAMIAPDDGAIAGSCGLMSRIGAGALEIGYWVAVDRVRNGFATLAAAGLTGAGLAIQGIERVEIHHDRANVVSGKVPARLGFTRLREEPVIPTAPGETGTHVIWAMDVDSWRDSPARQLLRADEP